MGFPAAEPGCSQHAVDLLGRPLRKRDLLRSCPPKVQHIAVEEHPRSLAIARFHEQHLEPLLVKLKRLAYLYWSTRMESFFHEIEKVWCELGAILFTSVRVMDKQNTALLSHFGYEREPFEFAYPQKDGGAAAAVGGTGAKKGDGFSEATTPVIPGGMITRLDQLLMSSDLESRMYDIDLSVMDE